VRLLPALALSAAVAFADPVLTWNGAPGGLWDASTANWLDEGDNAVVWQPGAEAKFDGSGGLVNVAADVSVSNITFAANGYTLLGAGCLAVEGNLVAAAGTTNSVAADLLSAGGLAKTGTGALALTRCAGTLAVQEGMLIVSGSLFADADVSVATGASLVTLGEPDATANLLLNSGFEDPALANGAWAYRDIPNWVRSAYASNVGMKNTAATGEWALPGVSPEGVQMAIVQGGGALSQTVNVPADGLYAVAFSYMMRNQSPAKTNQVYVSLGGVPLAAFVNRGLQTAPGRFASGALWLPAGTHTLTVAGEDDHGWADSTTLLDAVRFAPPSAAEPCRALGGDSTLALVTGASAVLSHSGAVAATLVTVNGAAVGGGTTYDASDASGIFAGPGSLAAQPPENVSLQTASGNWSAPATWWNGDVPSDGGGNNLLLRLTADSANDLSGIFQARRLQLLGTNTATLTGNTLALAGPITQPLPGTWTVSAPVSAASAFTVDNAGDLTFSLPIGITNTGLFVKSGSGALTLAAFTNGFGTAALYGGTVSLTALPSTPASWDLFSSDGTPVALRFTAPGTIARRLNLYGSGLPSVAVDAGGTVTLSDWTVAFGNNAAFDVANGDTLSLRQLLRSRLDNGMASAPMLLKTGPGTLEIRSAGADTDKNRAYPGTTVLRNGTLRLLEDDWGTLSGWTNPFNGRTYTGTGGSLGYNLLTNDLVVGDAGTDASDDLAIIASGTGRYIGHDIEIFDKGNSVTLGMTAGTVKFGGTITLHRDLALQGPADGVMVLNTLVAAPDFSGTGVPALSGLAGLVIEGSLPAAASLVMDGRALSFGTYAVKAQTLNALVLGSAGTPGTLNVDFGAGANDTLAVTAAGGLILSNTVINLYYAGSGLPFAEPGTYTLFTYSGTLGGDAALLSVGNPQGVSYVFADDAANHRVTLTISGTSGGVAAVWINKYSGNWGVGANWNTGSVPDGSGVLPLFGFAITNPASVSIDSARTVGGLLFNNATYGYTLAGSGGLTLATNAATPLVNVIAGTHTLDTALNGTDGLEVITASDATLILGSSAVASTGLTLSQGTVELQGNATVNGATALAASTLLRAASTTNAAVGTLSGAASAAVTLTGAAPKLTVNQSSAGTFAGTLSGASDAQLVKAGNGTLTLSGPLLPLLGQASVGAGTLALQSAILSAAVAIDDDATLSVGTPVTNGLMGFYYNVSPNTNNYWTLSAMESHFASLTPDFAALSGATSNLFDFGVGTTYSFPSPYNSSGSRSTYFEVVWRGTITLPASGAYSFGVYGDDGFLLAIDGKQVLARNAWNASWAEGRVTLEAGRHDIVLGYFQISGNGGIRMNVRQPNQTASVALPNAWLTPYSQTGPLNGGGSLALVTSDSLLLTSLSAGGATYGGTLSGVAGGLLVKAGNGVLSLRGGGTANAFAGHVEVRGGLLALDTDERISDTSTLNVRSGATLAVAATETVGALAGEGTLAVGGNVYVMPFIGDADSDISTNKTYTHLLDFPANGNPATVNSVPFTAAGMDGTAGGYSWSTVNPPTGAWNSDPNDATRTGIDRLLWDFIFGSMDFTLTLSNLTPGKAYETRLYFRNFASNTRNVTFTFTAGAHEIGSLYYNPDNGATGTRSWIGCRYTADSAGTVAIRVLSHDSVNKCHLYGLSNEELTGATSPVLTVAPATGTSARLDGPVTGLGELVKSGAGTQRFGGANSLPQPLSVEQGTAVLDPGASLPAGATVAAGAMLKAPLGNVTLGALGGEGTFELTGTADYVVTNGPHFVKITGDADCGVSSDKRYTHLLDFGGNAATAVVNGVTFNKERTVSGPLFGPSWINAPATSAHAGGNTGNIGVPSNQGVYNLINDFCYNGPYGPTVCYLTGLTIGKTYEVRFYHRKWEADKARITTFTFDPDGTGPISDAITFNPDSPAGVANYNDNYLAYRYFAQTNQLAVTITCPNTDKYHIYGLSNEEVPGAINGLTTLDLAADSVFDGTISGAGAWLKTGAGSFTVTGVSTATGAVAVTAGAFGVAENGRATAGPVSVAAGAMLFGHGQMGGHVTVASNAWLQAGTASACGTLQVGGDLTLAPGALPRFRFAAGAADAFTVGGLLTFPTNGVLQAEALSSGMNPPAKTALFTSPQVINGPASLTGWTVAGVPNCSLIYSADRTVIYLRSPRGTMILVR
jgi:uncharacterized membrane protein